MSRIALRTAGSGFATIESQVRAVLAEQYGPEVRALGASQGAVVRECLARSLITVAAAAAIGCGLSLLLAAPLTELTVPIFRGLAPADLDPGVITPGAVALGVGSPLAIGGLFGVLPLLPALRAPIAEALRE